jgi:FkbM family methyltransferase
MRKVFLDCGTNLCQGLNQISNENKIDESWIVYSFDANPDVFNYIDKSKYTNVNFINEGVWSESCERYINQELLDFVSNEIHGNGKLIVKKGTDRILNPKVGGSTNIMGDEYKWGHWIENDNKLIRAFKVNCFDFSSFIRDNFDKEDYIIVKLDIEGSEYEVMDKLIIDGTIDYINHFYVEWHNIDNRDRNYYISIINEKNIKYTQWY